MTELNQLFNEVFDFTVKAAYKTMDFGEFKKELNQKYSVTLRNTVSTAVNQKDDNLLNQEDLLSKIESLALANCSGSFKWCSEISMSENEFSTFAKELIKLFTSCLNPVFRALNDSDEQSIIK